MNGMVGEQIMLISVPHCLKKDGLCKGCSPVFLSHVHLYRLYNGKFLTIFPVFTIRLNRNFYITEKDYIGSSRLLFAGGVPFGGTPNTRKTRSQGIEVC